MPDSHKLSLSSLAVRGIAFEIVIKIRFNFLKYLHKLIHLDTHLVCNGLGICTFLSLALDLMIKLGEMDKKIESVMVNVASLEKTMTNIQLEVLSLKVRADSAETKLKEMDTGLQFANAEVEDLKTQSRNNQQSIVSLKERLLYQEVYNRRENLRFFGLPESTESTIEDSSEVLYRFLERDLDIEGARNIEFQRVHRLGRKKEGASRPIIARFLRYPDRERVFKAALEAQDEIDVKVYADLPKEIQENRKKQWPRLKRAREEGKTAYFSRKEPDKLFIEGRFVAS